VISVQARRSAASGLSAEDENWRVAGEASSATAPVIRKHCLRNITPRSYSSLLKSESDEEEDKADASVVKQPVAAAIKQGNRGFVVVRNLSVSSPVTVLVFADRGLKISDVAASSSIFLLLEVTLFQMADHCSTTLRLRR